MKALLLAAGLLLGCSPMPDVFEEAFCGQAELTRFRIAETADCWAAEVSNPACVVTARGGGACDVPDRSDELFAAGDEAVLWCDWFDGGDSTVTFKPVDCMTGELLVPVD